MNLCNVTKADFVELFGNETFELIGQYDVDVYLVDNDSAQYTMIGQNFATVYEHEDRQVAVFNIDRINGVLTPVERLVKQAGKHKRSGTVVHECVHLQQIKDGRLVVVDSGCYWEGKFYSQAEMQDGYFDTPWEHEAFVTEVMHVKQLNKENATAIVNEFIANAQQEIVKEKHHG